MAKRYGNSWLTKKGNADKLSGLLAILRAGDMASLETLPQDFLVEWKSSSSGAGAFHYAAKHCINPAIAVPFLVGRGMDPNEVSAKGASIMGHALDRERSLSIAWCAELLRHGARVDLMPCKGASLLSSGVKADRPEMVQLAVAAGASRQYPDDPLFKFKTPPEAHKIFQSRPGSITQGAQAFEDLLPPSQEDLDRQWLIAIGHGRFLWANHFVQAGADILSTDPAGNTGLHALARMVANHYRQSIEEDTCHYIEELCANGLSPHAPNLHGVSSIDIASSEDFGSGPKRGELFMEACVRGQALALARQTPRANRSVRAVRL